MVDDLTVSLSLTPVQRSRLAELQAIFVAACNSITLLVRETRCWNRVALHHMVYRQLRADFPALGSQMSCNVIYSVCRAARSVYQQPESPWYLGVSGAMPLPLIRFRNDAPVYFDRHTLSLRGGLLSLFTLDGRMRVAFDLAPEDQARFETMKLKEIMLFQSSGDFLLNFSFATGEAPSAGAIPGHIVVTDPRVEVLGERSSVLQSATDDREAYL